MTSSVATLPDLLAADRVTHVPGVFDPASAALAVRAGHRAVLLSGAAISATMLGRPDIDYAPATQIADRAAVVGPMLGGVPMLADAVTGFDRPDDAVWTALSYQRAGISGVRLIDGAGLATARIEAVVRQVPEVTVIAEARGRDLDEIIFRLRAYAGAGAHAVHPAGVRETADLRRIRAALPGVPLVLSRPETVPGGRWPADDELAAAGVRLVLHPLVAALAALRAASMAYRAIAEEGHAERVDLMPAAVFATFTASPDAPGRASAVSPDAPARPPAVSPDAPARPPAAREPMVAEPEPAAGVSSPAPDDASGRPSPGRATSWTERAYGRGAAGPVPSGVDRIDT